MKRLLVSAVILPLAAATGLAQNNVPVIREEAGECPLFAELALDVYSAYVWRGMVLNDEPVWQPGLKLGADLQDYGKAYAGAWLNLDLTKRNRRTAFGGLNELDYRAGYQIGLGNFEMDAGHRWYTFPKANGPDYGASTREVYASLAYANDIVVPFIEVNYDYSVVEGVYAVTGLRKEVRVEDRLTLGAEVTLGGGSHGMTKFYYGEPGKMWVTDANAALFATFDLTEHLFVGARLAWMSALDNRLKGVYHKDDILWGGISLGATF